MQGKPIRCCSRNSMPTSKLWSPTITSWSLLADLGWFGWEVWYWGWYCSIAVFLGVKDRRWYKLSCGFLNASDFGCSWQYCFKAIQPKFHGGILLGSFPCREACHSWSHAKGGGSFDVPLFMDQNWLISWGQNSKHYNSQDPSSLDGYPDTPPWRRIVSTKLYGLNNWCVGKISD